MNLICNTNLTTSNDGRCECRQDMKWNKEAGECQLFIDVDCSSITYDTKPSPAILEAVNKTLEKIDNTKEVELDTKADNATLSASPNVTLSNSLLSTIDPKTASKAEINEAFCRDVDSFSWEFGKPERERYTSGSNSGPSIGRIIGIVVGVIAVSILCCVCCVYCVCKGAKNKLSGVTGSDKQTDQPVTFSSIQQGTGDAGPGYNAYQASTPSYPSGGLPYPLNPGGGGEPPAIPPTQPGYSNYPPDYNQTNPYQAHSAPYPPVYPPASSQPPYNPGY